MQPNPTPDRWQFWTAKSALICVLWTLVCGGAVHAAETTSAEAEGMKAAAEAWDAHVKRHDLETACKKWKEAAEKAGDSYSAMQVANCYKTGIKSFKKDTKEALRWYRFAANKDEAGAQSELGYYYESGEEVAQDYVEASRYYKLAARQGDLDAQIRLAFMYLEGRGVDESVVKGHLWLNLAISNPNKFDVVQGISSRAAIAARNEVASKMTRGQMATAQKMAVECVKQMAT